MEALVELGAQLDAVADPVHQARIVLDGLVERFGFRRGVVVGASDGRTVVLAAHGAATVPTIAAAPDAVVAMAWTRREPLAFGRIDAGDQPDARPRSCRRPASVLVSPMIADGEPVGAIVVELGGRIVPGVSRRLASILGQLGAIAALNLRNAVLLRSVQDLAERDSLTGAANRRMFQIQPRARPALRRANPTARP